MGGPFDPVIPDYCPGCGASPYPHERACETCGLVGEPLFKYPKWVRIALWVTIAAVALGLLWLAMMIVSIGSGFPA